MSDIAYRLRILDGTLFSNATASLLPASGANHNEPFQVSTANFSGSGYKPFMRIPQGERGTFDLSRGSTEVGSYTIQLLDKRVGSDQQSRWVSAFIGDANGGLSAYGKKAVMEEFYSGSWNLHFVGRLSDIDLGNPNLVTIRLSDSAELMKQKIFKTTPAIPEDQLIIKSLLPLGLTADLSSDGSDSSKIVRAEGLLIGGINGAGPSASSRLITLSEQAMADTRNFWPFESAEDFQNAPNIAIRGTDSNYSAPKLRCMVQAGTMRHYVLDYMNRPENARGTKLTYTAMEKFVVSELPESDPMHSPLSALDDLVTIKRLWLYRLQTDDWDKLNTFWVRATPYTMAKNILDGCLFPTSSIQSVAIAVDSGSLASLATSQPQGNAIFRIDESAEAGTWIEENICKPYNVGYAIEPFMDGTVPRSRVRFFSTRIPDSGSLAGIPTIDGSDIVAGEPKAWSGSEPLGGVEFRFYMESENAITRQKKDQVITPSIATTIQTEFKNYILPSGQSSSVDASYKIATINMNGVRGVNKNFPNRSVGGSLNNTSAYAATLAVGKRCALEYWNRRKAGAPTVRLSTHRSSKTNGMDVGDWVFVEVDSLIDQSRPGMRGGQRLMQVTNRTPTGLQNKFTLVDSGLNEAVAVPTLGSLSSPSMNTVRFNITSGEPCVIEIEVAIVALGAAVPAAGSLAWMYVDRKYVNGTITENVQSLPDGMRIYVRIRSSSPDGQQVKLRSGWQTSSGIDLQALSAPSSVTVTNVTAKSAKVSWVNSTVEQPVEVWLSSPAASTPDLMVNALRAGSTTTLLTGLDQNSSTSHRVHVRYGDGIHGHSPYGTADFTASGSVPVLDAPAFLFLYVGKI